MVGVSCFGVFSNSMCIRLGMRAYARVRSLSKRLRGGGVTQRFVRYLKGLRGVDYVGLQVAVLDVSFRHVAGVNRRDDGAV